MASVDSPHPGSVSGGAGTYCAPGKQSCPELPRSLSVVGGRAPDSVWVLEGRFCPVANSEAPWRAS